MKYTSKLGKYLRSYSCLVYFAFRFERPEHRSQCMLRWTWEPLQQLWETIRSTIPHTSTGNKRAIYDERRGRRTRRHKQTKLETKNSINTEGHMRSWRQKCDKGGQIKGEREMEGVNRAKWQIKCWLRWLRKELEGTKEPRLKSWTFQQRGFRSYQHTFHKKLFFC